LIQNLTFFLLKKALFSRLSQTLLFIQLSKTRVAEGATPLGRIITQFAPGFYHLVTIVTENLEIQGTVGEAQILEALFQSGTQIQVVELLT
jgi:CBS-domain-containing membrane protein